MTITYHRDLHQGSDEWHAIRCGLLTASEVKLILTPTLKVANNDKVKAHIWELAAQRITGFTEPGYISDAMLRGHDDEIEARNLYSAQYAEATECGFVTNDEWGFTIGASPDGLVGEDGSIECKSRCQKYQIQTIVENYRDGTTPDEYELQMQTVMLVTGRKWCDLISYSGGLPMATMRVDANPEIQDAIIAAASQVEARIAEIVSDYREALNSKARLIPTERRQDEMIL